MPADTPIRASTQEFLSIEDIQDDIVLLKDGSCTLILQVTAVNFGLLSEGEQDAMIYAYAGLLNSLSFPIQIVIRSKKKDISSYLQLLKDQETKIKKPILIKQMQKYRAFVEATVRENEVLDKKFYVSIPFSLLELGVTSTLSQTFKTKRGLPYPKSYIFERAKTNLYPKRDHLMGQLRRLGVKSRQLTTQELLQLVYSIYNPESVGQQFVPSKDYATPMVQAATTQLPTVPGSKQESVETKKEVSMDNQSTAQPKTPPAGGAGTQPSPTPTAGTVSPSQPTKPSPAPSPSPSSAPQPPQPPKTSGGSQPLGAQAPSTMGGGNQPPSTPSPAAPSGSQPPTTPASPKPDAAQVQSAINSAAQQAGKQPTPQPPMAPRPSGQSGPVPTTMEDKTQNQ